MTDTQPIVTKVRIVVPGDYAEDFACTGCGEGLRGQSQIVLIPGRTSGGYTTYAVVHNRPICVNVVT